jgi:NAD+ kinase
MSTIAFLVHPERQEAKTLSLRAAEWLADRNHQIVVLDGDVQCDEVGPGPLVGADLAVSLGGDGTMLRTVNLAWAADVPVLGVNLGQLGYLTEVEPSRLEMALDKFLSGNFSTEERMMLEVAWKAAGDPSASHCLALNEAVVEKTVPGHTIRLATSIGGRPFVTYAADGLIVATATGSTAYNLSVRGPILSPGLHAVIVSPISPHMLFDRTLVLDSSESFELTVSGPRPGILVVDGRTMITLEPGDSVSCSSAERPIRFVTFGPRDFHSILRARFHLSDR